MSSASVTELAQAYRGLFHFTPPQGWINDPNGLSWYRGQLHLFYQHHPNSPHWGPMHWGHAVSTDLLKWDHRPIALAPDRDYDIDGCFSGSAAVDGDQHVLLFTGHVHPDPTTSENRAETQCLAWGDGQSYQKDPANPVIDARHLPPDSSVGDFRDPKLWKEGDQWYCLAANADLQGDGRLLLFRATNPTQWTYVGVTAASHGRLGGMWECPDFFRVGDREVLLWSAIGVPAQPSAHQNSHSVLWSLGSLDRRTGAFAGEAPQEIDHGPDFYAPQVVKLPDGRLVMVAWMQMWGRTIPPAELGHGWAGQMTLPREIRFTEGRLTQHPVRELEAHRQTGRDFEDLVTGPRSWSGVQGRHLDLELTFEQWAGAFEVSLLRSVNGHEETLVRFDPATSTLILDRSRGGHPIVNHSKTHPEVHRFHAPVDVSEGQLTLRVIVDRSSIEVFAQGGLVAMAMTVYPREEGDGVAIRSEGSVRVRGAAWPLA